MTNSGRGDSPRSRSRTRVKYAPTSLTKSSPARRTKSLYTPAGSRVSLELRRRRSIDRMFIWRNWIA
jgi:hypothetical protein